LSLTSLTVSNSIGSTTPSSDGTFTTTAYSGGPQFTLVTDKNGNPVLAGFLSSDSTTLDSLSTAKLLIYFAAAFYTLPSPYRTEMVDDVATAPGFTAVQNAIIAALQTNTSGLSANGTVGSALSSFVTALYAPSSTSSVARQLRKLNSTVSARYAHPLDVLVNPSTSQSGITTVNTFPDGVYFQNTYRRAAEAFIDQDSYVPKGGSRVPAPVQDVVPPVQIAPVSGLGNVTSSLVTAVQGVLSGATQYTPVVTSPVALSNDPSNSSTRYIITVVGAGNPFISFSLRSEESNAQKLLTVQQLVQDYLVPIVASMVIPLNASAIDNALKFDGGNSAFTDLVTTLTTAAPQIYTLMDSGQVGDALTLAYNTVATSNTVQAAFLQYVKDSIQSTLSLKSAQIFFEACTNLVNKLNVLSAVLVAADIFVVKNNILASNAADQFIVDISADKVTLTPQDVNVLNNSTQVFTANVPAASGSSATIIWQWTNTGKYGTLTDGIPGHINNFSSSQNKVTYTANPTGNGDDDITATAFLVQSSTRVQIGDTVAATVTVEGTPEIDEFSGISGGTPVGIVAGPDGNLWYADEGQQAIVKFTTSGSTTEYFANNSLATQITASAGALWFLAPGTDQIGEASTSGDIGEFGAPDITAGPTGIGPGTDGNVWFTVGPASLIGSITPGDLIQTYTPANSKMPPSCSGPGGIVGGPDKNIWFTDTGTGEICMMVLTGKQKGDFNAFPLPSGATPGNITVGSDGNLWFTDYNHNSIGKISTSGTVAEYPIPSSNAFPRGIALGPDHNIWFTEVGTSKVGFVTPNGTVVDFATPTENAGPDYIAAGPDGNVWFTEFKVDQIGKVNLNSARAAHR
jgi:streptogramin lyase